MIRKCLTQKVTFEQRPGGSEGAKLVNILGQNHPRQQGWQVQNSCNRNMSEGKERVGLVVGGGSGREPQVLLWERQKPLGGDLEQRNPMIRSFKIVTDCGGQGRSRAQ